MPPGKELERMKSFIGWIGGKSALRNTIMEQFPEKFNRYIEVFGGAGWVLFAKDRHAQLEVYNDKNGDLVNLFRCAKYHAPELQRLLELELNAREIFQEYLYNNRNNPFQTDLQRAVQFLLLIKMSYGCSVDSYGGSSKSIQNIANYLPKVQQRLDKVVIEHKDFADLIKQYDREDALFYLDPPYYGTEKEYAVVFPKQDHERLFECLKSIKGKFVLSYNNCEYIRDLYKQYNIMEVSRHSNLVGRYSEKEQEYRELIIKNF